MFKFILNLQPWRFQELKRRSWRQIHFDKQSVFSCDLSWTFQRCICDITTKRFNEYGIDLALWRMSNSEMDLARLEKLNYLDTVTNIGKGQWWSQVSSIKTLFIPLQFPQVGFFPGGWISGYRSRRRLQHAVDPSGRLSLPEPLFGAFDPLSKVQIRHECF